MAERPRRVRHRLSEIRDRLNAQFNRMLNEEEPEPSVIDRLQDFRPGGRPQPYMRGARARRPRQITFKVSVLRSADTTMYRTRHDATAPIRVVVPLDLTAGQFEQVLRDTVTGVPAQYQLCRINAQRQVELLQEATPADIHRLRSLHRSNLYIRPKSATTATQVAAATTATQVAATTATQVAAATTATQVAATTATQVAATTAAQAATLVAATTAAQAAATQAATTQATTSTQATTATQVAAATTANQVAATTATQPGGTATSSEPTASTQAISIESFMLWEDGDNEEPVMLASPSRSPSSNDEMDLQRLLQDFQDMNVDRQNSIIVVAQRRRILKSACLALSRNYFEWHKEPKIEFIGEMGDDYGGPGREFFRLLMREVQTMDIFEGSPEQLFFSYNLGALAANRFYTAGKLTAWSLAHNGPGPRSLNRLLFLLMCGETPDLSELDITVLLDEHQRDKFAELKRCTRANDVDRVKEGLAEWVADCGVPTIYTATNQDLPTILKQVTAHFAFHRVSSMVQQYTQGLNSCGALWTLISRNWRQFLPVFTSTGEKLSRRQIRSMFSPNMSEEMTMRRQQEEDTLYAFEQWLVAIEEGETEVHFEDLLVFATGADHVPSLGFPTEPKIEFYDQEPGVRRLPYASTCSLTLYLPRGVDRDEELAEMLLLALKGSLGFGKV